VKSFAIRPLVGVEIIVYKQGDPNDQFIGRLDPENHTVVKQGDVAYRLQPGDTWDERRPDLVSRFPPRHQPSNAAETIFKEVLFETMKESNPKDTVGSNKLPFSCVPLPVLCEVAAGMGEGAIKYGKHNWRTVGVRASVYFDATLRHLIGWYEGEDVDADSGVSHVSKAIASLCVLRDAMIQENWVDDRPPASINNCIHEGNVAFKASKEKHPDCGKHFDRESLRKRSENEQFNLGPSRGYEPDDESSERLANSDTDHWSDF